MDFARWEWLYAVDGGPEISFATGEGIPVVAEFTYPPDSGGREYRWRLRVTFRDGKAGSASITAAVR
jgi:hypothetical protein